MYKQFNGLHVILNCTYQDYELGKILKSSVNELFEFVKGNIESYHSRVEIRLPYNICHCYKWLDNVNGYVPEYRPFNYYHYYHRDCLKYWEKSYLFRIMELLNKSTVLSVRVLLEKCMIMYMIVNGNLMVQGLNYHQMQGLKLLIWKNLKKLKKLMYPILKKDKV